MRFLPLIIYTFFTLSVHSQNTLDSLNILSQSANKNTSWVDNMMLKIKRVVRSDPKKAYEYTTNVIGESKKMKYNEGEQNATMQLVEILIVLGKYDESRAMLKEVLEKTPKKNYTQRAKILSTFGSINFYTGNYDLALDFFNQAEELLKDTNEKLIYADLCHNKATVYSLKGNHLLAIENYIFSAKFYSSTNQKKKLAIVYDNIGVENAKLKRYQKAIKYHQLAIQINKEIGNLYDLSRCYINIGISYKDLDSFNLALKYYDKSLALSQKIGNPLGVSQNYLNIGNLYIEKHNYKKALQYCNKSLAICKKDNNDYGLVLNYFSIGSIDFKIKNYETAIMHLDSSLMYAKIIGLPKEESDVYEKLSEIYSAKGDYKNAFMYKSSFHKINDSLINLDKHKQIVELEEKYESKVKENIILELKTKEDSQTLIIGYQLIFVLILLLVVLWLVLRRKILLKEKKMGNILAEKLQLKIEIQNNELTQKALRIAYQEEVNKNIAIELINKPIEKRNLVIKNIIRRIKTSSNESGLWKEFDLRFEERNSKFYSKLTSEYSTLSQMEIRVACLLYQNYTTKEISEILQRSIKTIENVRTIIRKKIDIPIKSNLTTFLKSIGEF